jgi:hypothetical protein
MSHVNSLNRPGRRAALAALLAACAASLPMVAGAQAYPAKPIRIVVGYSAGGAVDIVARTLGQSLATSMGQQVLVDNKPGAGTNIAVKTVIDATRCCWPPMRWPPTWRCTRRRRSMPRRSWSRWRWWVACRW